jgi:hypothetical protein
MKHKIWLVNYNIIYNFFSHVRIHAGKILGGHDLSFVPCLSHWAEAPHTWEIMKFMQIEPWNSACYCYGQKHLKKYMKGKVPEICFHTNHT